MPLYTPEQFRDATNADLYDFLIQNHNDYFKKEGVWLRAKFNPSINIRQGFYGFIDFGGGTLNVDSGNGIKFLTEHMKYTETEAVLALAEGRTAKTCHELNLSNSETKGVIEVPPSFPVPDKGFPSALFAYLNKTRKISKEIIYMMLRMNIIYQYRNGKCINIMFRNPRNDWAEIHGTNTFAEQRCKKKEACTRYKPDPEDKYGRCLFSSCDKYKRDSFHGVLGNNTCRNAFWYLKANAEVPSETVYICEAAIDAVSLFELHQMSGNNMNAAYVSVGGVNKQETIRRILDKHRHPVIAVDNDDSGKACRERNKDVESIIPENTDWNEDLIHKKV